MVDCSVTVIRRLRDLWQVINMLALCERSQHSRIIDVTTAQLAYFSYSPLVSERHPRSILNGLPQQWACLFIVWIPILKPSRSEPTALQYWTPRMIVCLLVKHAVAMLILYRIRDNAVIKFVRKPMSGVQCYTWKVNVSKTRALRDRKLCQGCCTVALW